MTAGSRQLPLGVRLRDSSIFASYVAGRNRQVVAALVALTPGMRGPSVWLHGPTGTGKSHLLQALCVRAGESGESSTYLPLQQLAALGAGALAGCSQLDWVCIDDIEQVVGQATGQMAGQLEWERALFGLYTEMEEAGGRLVLAASMAPAALRFGLQDLASRLAGGTILRLQPLEEPEQIAALSLRAAQRGLELPDETAAYLLSRLPRDMHSLCAFLDTLDEASLVAQRRLTVPFVSKVLKSQRVDD